MRTVVLPITADLPSRIAVNRLAVDPLYTIYAATNEGVCRSIPRVQFLHKPFSVQSLLSAVQTGLADPSLSQLRAA